MTRCDGAQKRSCAVSIPSQTNYLPDLPLSCLQRDWRGTSELGNLDRAIIGSRRPVDFRDCLTQIANDGLVKRRSGQPLRRRDSGCLVTEQFTGGPANEV